MVDDQLIKDWLTRTGDSQEPCDAVVYKLRYLVNYLQRQNNDPKNGDLTDCQNLFIKWSESIYNCPSGLREGINLIYGSMNSIDDEATHNHHETIANVVTNASQKTIGLVFNHREYLAEACGFETDEEIDDELEIYGSHISEYLKNRLYLLLGLNHSLTFDRHTELLPDHLVNMDLHAHVNLYFKHFQFETWIRNIQNEITALLDTGGGSTASSMQSAKNPSITLKKLKKTPENIP